METRINRLFAAMLAVGISPAVSAYDPLYSEQWHLNNIGATDKRLAAYLLVLSGFIRCYSKSIYCIYIQQLARIAPN